MPVYLRKNLVFTPPSIDRFSDEDEDDYLQDPEQLRDVLPQPYRRIDKILNELLDDVWEIISEKERIKLAEQQKIRPPKYEASIQFPSHGQATALAESPDGRYLFLGLPAGLAVIDCQSQEVLQTWEEEKMEIVYLKAHFIGPQVYLIVALDDLGIGRLFGFCGDLYLLRALNEVDHNNTVTISKVEASVEADYVGVVMENTGTKEVWLDVLRLPRDQWLKELETAQAAAAKRAEQQAMAASVSQQPQQMGSARPTSPPPSFASMAVERQNIKFTIPSLVLHLKPPNSTITSQNHSLSTAASKIDTGDVIGMGLNHIVSSSHWEHRDAVFSHLHENLLKFLPQEEAPEAPIISATFHFLTPGRLMLTGPDGISNNSVPVGIAVWWTNGTHLLHYSFSRAPSSPKDTDTKPDIVWPFTRIITASAASPCSSLLAVGLESGTICVYDRYLGLEKGVMNISSEPIESIHFLKPYAGLQDSMTYRIQSPGALILVTCRDGAQYSINANHMRYTVADCIREAPENLDEKETVLASMPDAPELLLLVQRQGKILLRDWTTRMDVCELSLPDTHRLKLPWEPIISFGSGGHLVFLKGTMKEMPKPDTPPPPEVEPPAEPLPVETPDTAHTSSTKVSRRQSKSQLSKKTSKTKSSLMSEEKEVAPEPEVVTLPEVEPAVSQEPPSHLFVYTLRSFPPLDPYWRKLRKEVPLLVHTTVEQRAEALLKERIAMQAFRKQRMQARWQQLRNDLEMQMRSKESKDTSYPSTTDRSQSDLASS